MIQSQRFAGAVSPMSIQEESKSLTPSADRRLNKASASLVSRGLSDLTNSKNREQSLHTNAFDQTTYEALKPHLINATNHFYKSGMSLGDALRALLNWLKEVDGYTMAEIRVLKPHIMRYMEELRAWARVEKFADELSEALDEMSHDELMRNHPPNDKSNFRLMEEAAEIRRAHGLEAMQAYIRETNQKLTDGRYLEQLGDGPLFVMRK